MCTNRERSMAVEVDIAKSDQIDGARKPAIAS
jgi:hypothetical protein